MTDQTHPSLDEDAEPDLITFRDDDGFDSEGGGEKKRRPKRRWIVLGALTAIAAVVAIMVAPTMLRVLAQKDATLDMPEKINNFARDDSAAAKGTATDLISALTAAISLDAAKGAIYVDGEQTIMIFGGTALLWNPEDELDSVIKLMEDNDAGIRELQTVDPGNLGGVMKCGVTDDQPPAAMTVCGWADHGSIALALFPAHNPQEAAGLMRDFRAATLTR